MRANGKLAGGVFLLLAVAIFSAVPAAAAGGSGASPLPDLPSIAASLTR
jgi:hypothetical protein